VLYPTEKLILFGGYYCSEDMEVQQYMNDVHSLDLRTMAWTDPEVEGELPEPRSAHTACVIHKRMYVFGGQTHKKKNLNDVYVLKMSENGTLKWTMFLPNGIPPEPRHGHTAVPAFNNIIFFGGRGNENRIFNDVIILDTLHQIWIYPKVGGDIPSPRYYHASCAINHQTEIVMFGGVKPKGLPSLPRVYLLQAVSGKEEENYVKERIKSVDSLNNDQCFDIIPKDGSEEKSNHIS